ncbi:MAG: hypothetical protein KBC39_01205 [Thermotogae bacterium]|jgi:hypothetical protein|nr:hypothetical protein [Thermotogota bacterium]
MKKRSLLLVLISIVIGSFVFGANMPLMGRAVVASRENSGENVEYVMQVTLARVINELELTNEQLVKILTEAKSVRATLDGLKEDANNHRQVLLDLLVARKVEEAQALVNERKETENAGTVIAEYVDSVKSVFTYEQGEKLVQLLNRFVIGSGNQNTPLSKLRQEFVEKAEKGVQSQRLDQFKEGIQKRLGVQEGQARMIAKSPRVFNQLAMSFLTDWGIDLLERFIAVK